MRTSDPVRRFIEEPDQGARAGTPMLSVVIPVHDEAGNIAALVEEIGVALRELRDYEIVCVDDASSDGSLALLETLAASTPRLRVFAHGRQAGQSRALHTGARAARGRWIATLDGDGQNDPADLPAMLAALAAAPAEVRLVGGWRVHRNDGPSKRLASVLANALRRRLLHDGTPDTGCGIKLVQREVFLDLPYFDHMHRYLPALVQRAGWKTLSVPVRHRPRRSGRSKYGNLGRAWVGLFDLVGVAWLLRRSRPVEVRRVEARAAGRVAR